MNRVCTVHICINYRILTTRMKGSSTSGSSVLSRILLGRIFANSKKYDPLAAVGGLWTRRWINCLSAKEWSWWRQKIELDFLSQIIPILTHHYRQRLIQEIIWKLQSECLRQFQAPKLAVWCTRKITAYGNFVDNRPLKAKRTCFFFLAL